MNDIFTFPEGYVAYSMDASVLAARPDSKRGVNFTVTLNKNETTNWFSMDKLGIPYKKLYITGIGDTVLDAIMDCRNKIYKQYITPKQEEPE